MSPGCLTSPQLSTAVLGRGRVHNQTEFDTPERVYYQGGRVGYLRNSLARPPPLFDLLFSPSLGRAAVETQVAYLLVLAARPYVTSAMNSIPRPTERKWHLDRKHRRAALSRSLEPLTRESSCRETPQLGRPTNGFAFPFTTSRFPFEMIVSTAPTGQHVHHRHSCCTQALRVHGVGVVSTARGPLMSTTVQPLFRPAMLVSIAPEGQHAYGRHPSPYTTPSVQPPVFLQLCR